MNFFSNIVNTLFNFLASPNKNCCLETKEEENGELLEKNGEYEKNSENSENSEKTKIKELKNIHEDMIKMYYNDCKISNDILYNERRIMTFLPIKMFST